MTHTNKSCNEPLYHLYSPLHIINNILDTFLPTIDKFTHLFIEFANAKPKDATVCAVHSVTRAITVCAVHSVQEPSLYVLYIQ